MKSIKTILEKMTKQREHRKFVDEYTKNGNQVILIKDGQEILNPIIEGLVVKFEGKNGKIIIHHPIKIIENLNIICGDDSLVEIKESDNYYKHSLIAATAKNSYIKIGKNCSLNWGCNLIVDFEPNLHIILGDECMLAPRVWMRTSDGHSVLSMDNKLLNKGGNIEIGNNVWILQNCAILKKSFIPNNTIVGTYSVVNKKFDKEYTMIAGNPAKVVRENIYWSRKRPYEFTE